LVKKIIKMIRKNSQVFKARRYKDGYLPIHRSNEHLTDDETYVNSALQQISELKQYSPLSQNTSILDFGSGQGRLAIGLLQCCPDLGNYTGIDTDLCAIKWCKRWIHKYHTNYTFIHVDAHNARYNPTAIHRPKLPILENTFDVIFLNSVFSHMLSDDVAFYLNQLNKGLKPGGIIYLTAFIEEDVPDEMENPPGYLNKVSTSPLHRVRFNKKFFLNLMAKSGYKIIEFKHQSIPRSKQSVLIAEINPDQ
jgi:SAM-dependent methyltransferase